MLQYDERTLSTQEELTRQAYLLTGDPDRAQELAGRALDSTRDLALRHGGAVAAEQAKSELVRLVLAAPPAPRPAPAPPGSDRDVLAWQALHRLSPRRRAAIVLRYDEALSEEQSAARLGISVQAVRADVDAALLTLRTSLPREEDPWVRVTGALAAAGRGWLDYNRPAAPAAARLPEILSAPAPLRPRREGATRDNATRHGATRDSAGRESRFRENGFRESVIREGATRAAHRPAARSGRAAIAAAGGLAALLLLAAAVVVPRLGGGDPAAPAETAAVAVAGQPGPVTAARLAVPVQSVPAGLLNWPARGALAQDQALVTAAGTAWRSGAPAAERPVRGLGVLWAGRLEGRSVAVLQALDGSGRPRVAQVMGSSARDLKLQHAEPLHPGTALLSLLPPSGPSGRVRVLVSPEGQVADGLMASNPMSGMPLQATPVGDDGVSGVLPSPPGAPTCSRVVLLGLDPATGAVAVVPHVLESAVASADMLGAMPMEVEVGNAQLAPGQGARPETAWFTDGEQLAKKLPGTGTVTVAAFGPRLPARPLSATDGRVVSARAYELHRGASRYLGSVVQVAGRTVCSSVLPVGAVPSGPYGWALRCPVPGGSGGVVHVIGGAATDSVTVGLSPTRSPAGQQPYEGTSTRPSGSDRRLAFTALQVDPSGFPCGTGTVRATGAGGGTATEQLPVYVP